MHQTSSRKTRRAESESESSPLYHSLMDTSHARKDTGTHRPRGGERLIVEVLSSGDSFPGDVETADDTSRVVLKVDPRGHELPVGTGVRLIYVRKDGLYERTGKVMQLTEGLPLVVNVTLFGEAARSQRRDHARMDASLNVDVVVGDHVRTRCVTKDVSGGGVSLLIREGSPIYEGQEFAIMLNVPDGRLPIRSRCQAKFVRAVLGSRSLVGSQFVEISEEDRQRLVRFVFRLTLMQGRSR